MEVSGTEKPGAWDGKMTPGEEARIQGSLIRKNRPILKPDL